MPASVVLRRAAVALGIVAAATVVWTVLVMVSVKDDLESAREALEQVRTDQRVEDVAPALDRSRADLERAVARLRHPGPALAAVVPVLGRPVRAVGRTANAALAVVRGSADVVYAATPDRPLLTAGTVDLEALTDVAAAMERAATLAREPVDALAQQPTGLLPSLIGEPVEQAKRELVDVPDRLARSAAGLRALIGILGSERPRSLLLLLENNAELRGTGGLVSVYAQATARDGRLEIGAFGDVDDVAAAPSAAVEVPAPADYERLWGTFLANTTLWKNVNMSPDAPTASTVLADVAGLTLGTRPDAVVWFDVPTMAAVLEATGPATLPDGSALTADNAVETLLSRAYRDAPNTDEGQQQRRALLRGAADVVLARLLSPTSDLPLGALAAELADAAAGRHLLVWSDVEEEQAGLVAAGLAGEVAADGADLSAFTVQNLGGGNTDGNKLDFYAERQVEVDVVLHADEAVVEQRVSLRNTAPDSGLPVYVAGEVAPGTTNNLVTMALPAQAELLSFTRGGQALLDPPVPTGDHQVVTDVLSLPPGTGTDWVLRYRTPVVDGRYDLRLVPQPLAFDASLDVQVRATPGLDLDVPVDSVLRATGDGDLALSQPFSEQMQLRVRAESPNRLQRMLETVGDFWSEPVPQP